jgi:uncharacterized protein
VEHIHRPSAGENRTGRGWTLVPVLATLTAVNVINKVGPPRTSLIVGPGVACGLVVLARRAGLSWQDLGLDRTSWRRGARWAAVLVGGVAGAYAVAAAVPVLRLGFRDARYDQSASAALVTALVVIPLGTVLLEEVAFRGVLWAWIRRDHGTRQATVWSSVVFGLWHVLPSLGLSRVNEGVGTVAGDWAGEVGPVAGAVVFTGLAGVLLCELRRRSGSLLAPMGLHWATNGLGVLAATALGAATRS